MCRKGHNHHGRNASRNTQQQQLGNTSISTITQIKLPHQCASGIEIVNAFLTRTGTKHDTLELDERRTHEIPSENDNADRLISSKRR